MKYIIPIFIITSILSCSSEYEKDRNELKFLCDGEDNSFVTGMFNDNVFCYSQNTGHTPQFLSSATVITESNTIEVGPDAIIGDQIYHKLWRASIDINNAQPFDHFITIKSPPELNKDSLKDMILLSLDKNVNLISNNFSIEFVYIDNQNFSDGGGKSTPTFSTDKNLTESNIFIESLDTLNLTDSFIRLNAIFSFTVELFDSEGCYFASLNDCIFEIEFEM